MSTNCTPYPGELNEDWLPITETGELYMPGIRSCNHKDCVNPDHVGKTAPTCDTPECDNKPYSQGLCNKHFYAGRKEPNQKQTGRLLNNHDLLEEIINTWEENETAETCSYQQCNKPFKAKGVCFTHYMSWYQRQRRLAKQQPTDLQ